MKMSGSDLPLNLGKSSFWKRGGGRSVWVSPMPILEPEDDGLSAESTAMALALTSAVASRDLMLSTSYLMVAWRSSESPMDAA
jgi:hypothetical protein